MKCLITVTAALVVIVAMTPDVALAQTTLHAHLRLFIKVECQTDVTCPGPQHFHYTVQVTNPKFISWLA